MCGKTSKAKTGKRECVCMCGKIGRVKKGKRGVCGKWIKKTKRKKVCVCVCVCGSRIGMAQRRQKRKG